MLLIKNGLINAKKLIFALPEGMLFYDDTETYAENRLRFIDESNSVQLCVHVLEYKDDYSVDKFVNHESFIALTDLFTVNRCGLFGKAVFYRNRIWSFECYEEQLDIGEDFIVSIRVTCDVNPNTRNRIQKVLMSSPINDFLCKIKSK